MKKNLLRLYLVIPFLIILNGYCSALNTIIGTVSDPSSTFNNPISIAITPDGTKAYVADSGANQVSIINLATNTVIGVVNDTALHSLSNPFFITITPDGTKGYAINNNNTISIIDIASNSITSIVSDPGSRLNNPQAIAISPDNLKGYITNQGNNSVAILNVSTETITATVASPNFNGPGAVVFKPDNSQAFVINEGNSTVSVINSTTNTAIGIVAGSFSTPSSIVVTPDGTQAYVTNLAADNISIIDTSINTVIADVSDPSSLISHPRVLAITPNGKTLYVIFLTGIGIVDVATNTVTGIVSDPLATLNNPSSLAITPNSLFGYITNSGGNSVSILSIQGSSPNPSTIVFPPNSIQACTTKNIFLTQTDFVNIISWTAPTNGTRAINFKIYRNAQLTDLVATIPITSSLKYFDHNLQPHVIYTYYIVSIDENGNTSAAASITATKRC